MKEINKALKEFGATDRIAFAFLFGSQANGKAKSYLEKKITE